MTAQHIYIPKSALPCLPVEEERAIAGADFDLWQPKHQTIELTLRNYASERLMKKGKNFTRAMGSFWFFMDSFDPQQDVETISIAQVEDHIDFRRQTVKGVSIRRELTFVKAAILHAHRRGRISKLPVIELPDDDSSFRRPLAEEEFRLVMRQPMSKRLRKFYKLAYYTGHRPRALEELTWDRVDFDKLTIDFNIPGRAVNNKRRNGAFPIPDDFLPLLRQWKETATDEYVIGLGPRGRCTTTYHEAAYVVRELAGIKDPSLVPRHCMRKMFATACFEKRADPEVVGWLMADNPQTLRKHYVRFKDETVRGVANLRAAN